VEEGGFLLSSQWDFNGGGTLSRSTHTHTGTHARYNYFTHSGVV